MIDGEAPDTLEAADAALTAPVADEPETDLPAEAPAADEGQPRDEQGRFASPAPAEETEAAPEADQVESQEPRDEPTADEPVDQAPDEDYPEATFEADGQEVSLSGTAVGQDGVFISPETWERDVVPLIQAGRIAQGSFRQRLSDAAQQVQSAQQETTAAKAQSDAVLGHFEGLIEKSQEAIQSGNPEAILRSPVGQWLLAAGQQWPILKAEARVKAVELQAQQATKRLEGYDREQQQARMRPVMSQVLQQSVQTQASQMGLDPQTVHQVIQKLSGPNMERILFVPAPFDDPMGAFRKGETVIDHSVVQGALELASINRVQQVQQQQIAQAQRRNAQQQPAVRRPPPTVGAKGRSVTGPAIPQPKTAKEADEMLLNGNLDWAEEA